MPSGVYVRSEAMKFKMVKIGKERIISPKFTRRGIKISEEIKKKLSEKLKGRSAWNKGKKGVYKPSEETRKKQSEALRGEKSHLWKGGICPINLAERKSIKYKFWREAVFARDNWTCRKCKQRGGKLNAHHLVNFSENKELRTALDNGITLCKKCHDKIGTHPKTNQFIKRKVASIEEKMQGQSSGN